MLLVVSHDLTLLTGLVRKTSQSSNRVQRHTQSWVVRDAIHRRLSCLLRTLSWTPLIMLDYNLFDNGCDVVY